jgi:hypothetical protein
MLLPALNQARNKAHEIACLNNNKQIGLASAFYCNDNNDFFVPYEQEGVSNSEWNWAWELKNTYNLPVGTYICPKATMMTSRSSSAYLKENPEYVLAYSDKKSEYFSH